MKKPGCECIESRKKNWINTSYQPSDLFVSGGTKNDGFLDVYTEIFLPLNFCPQCGAPYKEEE